MQLPRGCRDQRPCLIVASINLKQRTYDVLVGAVCVGVSDTLSRLALWLTVQPGRGPTEWLAQNRPDIIVQSGCCFRCLESAAQMYTNNLIIKFLITTNTGVQNSWF